MSFLKKNIGPNNDFMFSECGFTWYTFFTNLFNQYKSFISHICKHFRVSYLIGFIDKLFSIFESFPVPFLNGAINKFNPYESYPCRI